MLGGWSFKERTEMIMKTSLRGLRTNYFSGAVAGEVGWGESNSTHSVGVVSVRLQDSGGQVMQIVV